MRRKVSILMSFSLMVRSTRSNASGSRSSGLRKSMQQSPSTRERRSRKFILLARVASPQARQAILEHKGWDLWDKEDISREVRDLPGDEQRRLVDIFFRGQRMALLGSDTSSPWQTGRGILCRFHEPKRRLQSHLGAGRPVG